MLASRHCGESQRRGLESPRSRTSRPEHQIRFCSDRIFWTGRRGVYASYCIQRVTLRWSEIIILSSTPIVWRGVGGVCNFVGTTCYSASCLVGENGKLGLWAVCFGVGWGVGGWFVVFGQEKCVRVNR